MGETAAPVHTPAATSDSEWTDEGLLRLFGLGMTAAGLLLLAAAGTIMGIELPLTLNGAIGFMISLAFGIALLAIGLLYVWAAASARTPRLGIEGLSVCTDPETQATEWIKVSNIEKAILRPWSLSPWLKTRRYYEVELKVKEGDIVVDDTFLVHINPGFDDFRAAIQAALGDRFKVEGIK